MNLPSKQQIKEWFKDRDNLLLVLIILIGVIIRFYYYNMNSTVWWDESEYLSTAKHWAFGTQYDIGPQRLPLIPFLGAILFKLGFSEAGLRFFLVLIPSIIVIYLFYLLGRSLYNKKAGLIVAFLMTTFWVAIFNTNRFHTDMFAFMLWLIGYYFFWNGYIQKKSRLQTALILPIFALAFLTRSTTLIVFAPLFIFTLITERLNFLKSKELWISVFLAIVVITPYLIWSYNEYGSALAFSTGYTGRTEANPIAWSTYTVYFPFYLEWFFLIVFLISLALFYKLILGFDTLIKKQNKELYPDLFIFLIILIISAFFAFYIRPPQQDERWMIMIALTMFLLIANFILWLYEKIKIHSKELAIIICLAILLYGSYLELSHADTIIKIKKDTYIQIKDACNWINANSNPTDIVLSISYPQTVYYCNAKVYTYSGWNESYFDEYVQKNKPHYLIISAIEPNHPQYIFSYPQKHPDLLKPVQAFTMKENPNPQQPVLIVYEFMYKN